MKTSVKRLYQQFQPDTYVLRLTINESTMTFDGTVTITGQKTGRPSKRITLHQKNLAVSAATITHHDKKGHAIKDVARINTHGSYEEVRLHTDTTMFPGKYEVTLTFSGTITRSMNGIYPCFYEENGKKKQFIATQFESHHAREVFPCIDEPEAKAVFELTLETRKNTTVLSNTPVKTRTDTKDTCVSIFEPTPIMSTYLLAFVVGDMAHKEAKTARGVVVSTYSTPDNLGFTDFALETAVRCIDFYEEYFGINYPLAKCDLIALPDFASGAMENWGCITFREQCMLVDDANTSLPTKQYVAMVVAHELAHMWFGNLVTMRWWTDLWLNEGFASWIEYMATDKLFPEWQMWTQFIVDEQQQALRLDALENTHPIEVPVRHPDEIRTIFDAISYSKGASVIHQLHAYIGPKAFKEGLHLYLNRHAYSNTNTTDLWAALAESSGKDVASFMQNWTAEPGYPILHVKPATDGIELSQRRFMMVAGDQKYHTASWHIPLLDNSLGEAAILASTNMSLVMPPASSNPLLFNKERSGFYRVSYEHTLLMQLAALIDDNKLEPLDRLGILGDLFEASKSGDADTVTALEFLSHYSEEQSAVVWNIIAGMIGSIRLVLGSDDMRTAMRPFIVKLCTNEYKRLSWDKIEGESYFDQLLRPTILGLMASANVPEVLQKCKDIFAENTKKPKQPLTIDPDMRGIVFSTVARLGDQSTFDALLELYNDTQSSEEKLTLAGALTDFEDPKIIDQALDLIRSDAVRLQDIGYWVAYSFMNYHSREKTWHWLKKNWSWLQQNLGEDMSFHRMPIYAARVYSDTAFANSYREFFEARMSPQLERSYKQGLEMVEWHSTWRERDYKPVLEFFIAHQ